MSEMLVSLVMDDAPKGYEAITFARPAGMGRVEKYDITEEQVNITLKEAMWLAKDRDSIARKCVTDYEITFEFGYPSLMRHWEQSRNLMDSIVQTSLTILAEVSDTLIGRKNGPVVAEEVSRRARRVLELGGAFSEPGREAFERLRPLPQRGGPPPEPRHHRRPHGILDTRGPPGGRPLRDVQRAI